MTDCATLVSIIVPCWDLEIYLDESLFSVVARNAALAGANGEFVAMLDGDDIWKPDAIEHWIAVASRYPEADAIATDYSWFEHEIPCAPSGHVTLGSKAQRAFSACHASGEPLLLRDPFNLVATIRFAWLGATRVRRTSMEKMGGFDQNFRTHEDTLLWLRLVNRGSFMYSTTVTAHFRQRAAGIVHALKEPNEFRYLKVLDWVRGSPEFLERRRIVRTVMADCHHINAVHIRKRRKYGRAKIHAQNAIKLHPTSLS